MAAVVLPARSRLAKALREPNLLVPGKKPVGTIRLNDQNQIAKRFMNDAGVYLFDGENIKNLCPCSDAGDLTKIGGELVTRPQGRGLYTDNTGTASAVSLTTPDPGFWHDAKSTFTAFFHVTLEVDNIGPAVLIDIGGATNGFAVGYRTAPDTIVFATAVSGSNVEIASSTTYVPTTELRVIAKYDNGAMSLFINGIKVASGSNGTSIHAHGNEPGVLGYSGDVSLTGTASRWGGALYSEFLTFDALTDDECYGLSADPYQIFMPDNDAPFLFPVATGGITLSVNGALHSHTSDQPILTQAHSLSANDATHDHSAEQPSLSTAVDVTPADADHAHAAEQPPLVQQHILGPDDAAHAHLADQPALVQQHVLVVAEATHNHTADNVALTVAGTLAVADALHGHTADQPVLTQAHQLAPDDADHGHTVGQPALTQAHVLLAADALHGHTAGQPALDLSVTLAPSDAAHAQLADSPILTQANLLAVQDALHAHYADSPTLPIHVTLVASDALHAHLADNAAVIVGTLETPAGRVYLVESRVTAYRADSPVAAHLIH